MADDDTRALIARARSGDSDAFDALASRYRARLEAVVRSRLGDALRREVAPEDVVQETFLRAFRAIDRFVLPQEDGGSPFFGWL